MFQLVLRTAMRMRELYTLQQAQIRIEDKTIYLSKSKNGDRRQVPLNGKARAVLETPWPALEAARRGAQFLQLWDGVSDPKALAATTARLSRMFANVFAEAGMRDARTRQRYLSLRGSELADILG
jgi:integrase